jgi:hypothetical protein
MIIFSPGNAGFYRFFASGCYSVFPFGGAYASAGGKNPQKKHRQKGQNSLSACR